MVWDNRKTFLYRHCKNGLEFSCVIVFHIIWNQWKWWFVILLIALGDSEIVKLSEHVQKKLNNCMQITQMIPYES